MMLLVAITATSCFDDQYTDKDISTEVQLFGDGITIPIGSSSAMYISDFIDLEEQEGMAANEDGVYTISQSGNIPQSIDAINEDGIEVDINVIGIDVNTSSLTGINYYGDIPVEIDNESTTIDIVTELPDQVVQFKYATLGDGSLIELRFDLDTNITFADITFNAFTVEFPDFLDFADSGYDNALLDKSNNTLTLNANSASINNPNGKFVTTNGVTSWVGLFKVESLEFTDSKYDNIIDTSDPAQTMLRIEDEKMTCDGDINIKSATTTTSSTLDFTISLDISTLNPNNSNSMVIDAILGEFAIDVEIESESVSIGEVLSDDLNITAQITNPTIEIVATNQFDIPIEINGFSLIPQDAAGLALLKEFSNVDGIDATGAITVDDFVIPALASNYSIVISTSGGSGENQVAAPAMGYILANGIPANVEINMDAALEEVTGSDWHTVEIVSSHDISIDYEVLIPLEFEDIYMSTSTQFDGLQSSLSEFGDYITNIGFIVEATNTLPLELSITSIEPLDEDGNVITDGFEPIISSPVSIQADSDSEFSLYLNTNGDADKFAELDGLNLTIEVTGGGDGASLSNKNDEYLKFFLKLSLPEGVIVNFDDLDFGGDDEDNDDDIYDDGGYDNGNYYYDEYGNIYYY